MIVVRFADGIGIGFQTKADAEQFRDELAERMRKFNLELHPVKTRLLEFGPFAVQNRRRRGVGRSETFDFLGFAHICVKMRTNGMYTVLRQTTRKRLQAKLNGVKVELQLRMHHSIPEQGKWLEAVVRGNIQYCGVPVNQVALHLFRHRSGWLWHRDNVPAQVRAVASAGIACGALARTGCLRWWFIVLIPSAAWASSPKAGAGCDSPARPDLWRGLCAIMVPTPTDDCRVTRQALSLAAIRYSGTSSRQAVESEASRNQQGAQYPGDECYGNHRGGCRSKGGKLPRHCVSAMTNRMCPRRA